MTDQNWHAVKIRELIGLRLIRFEMNTIKSLGRERSNAEALSVVPFFFAFRPDNSFRVTYFRAACFFLLRSWRTIRKQRDCSYSSLASWFQSLVTRLQSLISSLISQDETLILQKGDNLLLKKHYTYYDTDKNHNIVDIRNIQMPIHSQISWRDSPSSCNRSPRPMVS